MVKVDRPKADKKKIHCKNEFELCYLRHQYLRKVDFNPSEKDMAPFNGIISYLAKNTYFTYRNLFGTVGLEYEDLINIARVHLVSYLGLFSMEKMPEKYSKFVLNHILKYGRDPDSEDLMNKNKANLTLFLKQRMEDLVRVCRQKVRNIKGFSGEECSVYVGPNPPPQLNEMAEHYEKYGFKKLDIAVFKTIRKRAKAFNASMFQFNEMWYVSVRIDHKNLSLDDLAGADLSPYDNIHYMDPERIYFDQQEDCFWQDKRQEFYSYGPHKRARLLRSFIEIHKDEPKFKEEVRLANKLLKETGV